MRTVPLHPRRRQIEGVRGLQETPRPHSLLQRSVPAAALVGPQGRVPVVPAVTFPACWICVVSFLAKREEALRPCNVLHCIVFINKTTFQSWCAQETLTTSVVMRGHCRRCVCASQEPSLLFFCTSQHANHNAAKAMQAVTTTPYLMINHWVVEHTTYSNLLNVAARNILKPRLEAIGCSLIKC